MTAPRLSRAALAAAGTPLPAPPVRIVHLGVGAFHRAHQAWYTHHAGDDWGIAAFTGRRAELAHRLGPQDGLFTVVERGPDADRVEIVGSIARAHRADEVERMLQLCAAPETAVITLTITEAGYHLGADGALDTSDPAVAADIAALRAGAPPATPVGRLVAGLHARARAGAGPLAVVACDNLPELAARLRDAVAELASAAGLPPVEASFVATSVDRITPHETDAAAVAAATGWHDEAAVVTEPFSDWTLCGEFPAGRPAWERAGALFVDDIVPFERRKLLLLNGGHLQLAFHGLLRGHVTIAEAVRDPACRAGLESFWDEAARTVGPGADTEHYRAALLERFENPRIEHRLAQIAVDTATKLRIRILPVIAAETAQGWDARGARAVIQRWRTAAAAGLVPDVPPARAGREESALWQTAKLFARS
ncbi:mannitol dehydrogenase family protein [Microbacterium protaetiae]|uniref:mannitol dehydrogenase family protein n=1 Tax=Microbacterium protaetiae TaxID=2509458 RepID=UPI001F5CE877|nr:mannitol dehydrogenase family protein [Microbacterium protaetiae]